MDVPKPPQYIEDLPEGPPNVPGGFDVFQNEQYTDPYRDQKMRRLEHYPLSFTNAVSQTIEVPEIPAWYLICLQGTWTTTPVAGLNLLHDLVATVKQGQGDTIDLRVSPTFVGYFDGVIAQTLWEYSSVRRYIAKGESRQLIFTTAATNGVGVTMRGNLYLIGANVDPTKVGEY